MKIKQVDPTTLIPYEGNPRIISDASIDAVAKSIESAGFRQPVVVDEAGVIVIGHTRTRAAIKLGLAKVPVHVATGLSDDQVKALRLNDNKSAEISEWDNILLGLEVGDLASTSFDLDSLTFSDEELTRLLESGEDFEPLTDPSTGKTLVDDDDIDKATGEQNKMGERSKQILVEVTCPECAAEFFLQPEDMKE